MVDEFSEEGIGMSDSEVFPVSEGMADLFNRLHAVLPGPDTYLCDVDAGCADCELLREIGNAAFEYLTRWQRRLLVWGDVERPGWWDGLLDESES